MAKDGTDVVETGDGITRRGFRNKHSAGNEAVTRVRGKSRVAQSLLT
jgi:hypothetical protein